MRDIVISYWIAFTVLVLEQMNCDNMFIVQLSWQSAFRSSWSALKRRRERIKKQPRALRHASPTNIQVSVVHFCNGLFCPQFVWLIIYWNERCSRRVFLCVYSAISQVTSAKFQTFAYNSRTVWSRYMKFWQQFESNELHVCTKFRRNRSRDFGFKNRKPPRKFGVISGLSQKRLEVRQKICYMAVCLKIPFHPN